MTNCTVTKNENDLIVKVVVENHANSDLFGRDIVCNSISIATQFMLFGIGNTLMLQPDKLVFEPKNALVDLELNEVHAYKSDCLTKTFVDLMMQLEKQHPNYIKMEVLHEPN